MGQFKINRIDIARQVWLNVSIALGEEDGTKLALGEARKFSSPILRHALDRYYYRSENILDKIGNNIDNRLRDFNEKES